MKIECSVDCSVVVEATHGNNNLSSCITSPRGEN